MNRVKLSVVIPCYNEEKGIPNLKKELGELQKSLTETYDLDYVFVDDGSKDNTSKLLKKHFGNNQNVQIITHKQNMNLGAAIRTGFAHAHGDIIATIDSDCTYPPALIKNMLALLDSKTDIVTASPYHPLGVVENVPRYRLFLSKNLNLVYSIITGHRIYTFTALFRVQRRKVVRSVHFKSNNFLATAEILVYALCKGYRVKEFPTTLHARRFGVSKMRILSVIWSHLRFMPKAILIRVGLITV